MGNSVTVEAAAFQHVHHISIIIICRTTNCHKFLLKCFSKTTAHHINVEQKSCQTVNQCLLMFVVHGCSFLTIFIIVAPVTSTSPSLPVMMIHPESNTQGQGGLLN